MPPRERTEMAFLDRTARSLLLSELVAGLWLTLRYYLPQEGDDQLSL